MYSVILTEFGISVFDNGNLERAFPFSNAVKDYLSVKNKEAKTNELVNYLFQFKEELQLVTNHYL